MKGSVFCRKVTITNSRGQCRPCGNDCLTPHAGRQWVPAHRWKIKLCHSFPWKLFTSPRALNVTVSQAKKRFDWLASQSYSVQCLSDLMEHQAMLILEILFSFLVTLSISTTTGSNLSDTVSATLCEVLYSISKSKF